MSLANRKWARRKRDILRELLGGVCQHCGNGGSPRHPLQFDCKIPRGDRHHEMEWSWRMCFYSREYREGNLQLLCFKCHDKKTKTECRERRTA